MKKVEFLDKNGSFRISDPDRISYLYFPVAGEGVSAIRSAVTPKFGGDAKRDQNTFLLEPVSAENLHNNRSTRNFWCKFPEGGAWSATGASAECEAMLGTQGEEHSELTAGFMWQTVKRISETYGMMSEITLFVPTDSPETEVMLVRLTNTGEKERSFTPVAAIPMYARSADNIRDHRHVTSLLHRTVTTAYGVEVTPTLTFDERGHKKNKVTYFVYGADGTGKEPAGFVPATEDFIGEGGSFTHPAAVYGDVKRVSAGAELSGYETTGALFFEEILLQPGETAEYVVFSGIDDTNVREELKEKIEKRKFADWELALEETKRYWQEQVNISFQSGEEAFDRYMRWVAFQPMLRRIYGCSFLPHHDYGKGGRGWRDLWQDCLALLLMNPAGVRQMLLANFEGVRMDGTNATIIGSKPGEFVADRNNITRVWMDHGFWPLHTIQFYIHQTGDLAILLEEAGYFKDRQAQRGTQTDEQWTQVYGTGQKSEDGTVVRGTVLEHLLLQNLTACYDVGEHNHLKLRGADWNDALDMAWERGESVAFSCAYAGNLGVLCELLLKLKEQGVDNIILAKEMETLLCFDETVLNQMDAKRDKLAAFCDSVRHTLSGEKISVPVDTLAAGLKRFELWMKENIRAKEWLEGETGFFNGYYDNHGRQAEANTPENLRMMLTGQVFAVMSGTATEEQVAQILASADRHLYDETRGGYALNTDFREVKDDLGRMFGFAYGHKENGAVFSHMAVMFGNALYQRGCTEGGYKALHTLYRQAADIENSKIYPGIPEYFNDRGRGMYHYLTGAASWYLMTVLTEMYGVKGRYGDLVFEPQLLPEQFGACGEAKAEFLFAGKKLRLIYRQEESAKGKPATECDVAVTAQDKTWDGARIPRKELETWEKDSVHEIIVCLKKKGE